MSIPARLIYDLICLHLLTCLRAQFFTASSGQPPGKDVEMYLPLPHGDGRFPLLAINYRENRQYSAQNSTKKSSWVAAGDNSYRALRPKFLYYLKRGKRGVIEGELRPVKRVSQQPSSTIVVTFAAAHRPIRATLRRICSLRTPRRTTAAILGMAERWWPWRRLPPPTSSGSITRSAASLTATWTTFLAKIGTWSKSPGPFGLHRAVWTRMWRWMRMGSCIDSNATLLTIRRQQSVLPTRM